MLLRKEAVKPANSMTTGGENRPADRAGFPGPSTMFTSSRTGLPHEVMEAIPLHCNMTQLLRHHVGIGLAWMRRGCLAMVTVRGVRLTAAVTLA